MIALLFNAMSGGAIAFPSTALFNLKIMIKRLLNSLPLFSVLMLAQVQQPTQASEAFCVVKGASDEIQFQGDCTFEQFGGNGSFSIKSPSGLIAGRAVISVYITEPGIAEVRGLTTGGINSRWGEARRSSSDPACWAGSDFTICAY